MNKILHLKKLTTYHTIQKAVIRNLELFLQAKTVNLPSTYKWDKYMNQVFLVCVFIQMIKI